MRILARLDDIVLSQHAAVARPGRTLQRTLLIPKPRIDDGHGYAAAGHAADMQVGGIDFGRIIGLGQCPQGAGDDRRVVIDVQLRQLLGRSAAISRSSRAAATARMTLKSPFTTPPARSTASRAAAALSACTMYRCRSCMSAAAVRAAGCETCARAIAGRITASRSAFGGSAR